MKAVFSQFCLAALICVCAGTFDRAQAQYTKYQPGDRVEVMYSGRWQPGTVMPLAKNDLNRTGSKYRVKIDSVPDYLQPEGTEIMIEDMRSGGAPTAGNEGEAPLVVVVVLKSNRLVERHRRLRHSMAVSNRAIGSKQSGTAEK